MRYSSFQAVLTRPATIKHLLEGNIGLTAPSQRIIDDNKRNFWQEIILGETTLDNSTLANAFMAVHAKSLPPISGEGGRTQ